jgi:hypothetical protein
VYKNVKLIKRCRRFGTGRRRIKWKYAKEREKRQREHNLAKDVITAMCIRRENFSSNDETKILQRGFMNEREREGKLIKHHAIILHRLFASKS